MGSVLQELGAQLGGIPPPEVRKLQEEEGKRRERKRRWLGRKERGRGEEKGKEEGK